MKPLLCLLASVIVPANVIAQPAAASTTGDKAQPSSIRLPLSPATIEKIARMKPIFDGRSLAGWVQAPPAPNTVSANDLTDVPAFARFLTEKPDAVSAFLVDQLDEPGKAALVAFSPTSDLRAVTSVLVRNMNRLVGGPSLYDDARFRHVRLRSETEAWRRKTPRGQDLMRLNRLLLEDAFPKFLRQSPDSSWIVKDGAMASTGGGRGVIYTKDDYTHYRLVFTMRHVSGKPDHHPCILIFCTRPPEGERGLDALGAIQFQTPNGGHWDYRPGQNKAGTGFTRPVRTTYDNSQWHQVEILVNAKTGKARMAVAQPVGTRGIENLTFSDPAAAKTGPIAWQMHNAGLFDEFKDVRIEIDPKEDRLISVE